MVVTPEIGYDGMAPLPGTSRPPCPAGRRARAGGGVNAMHRPDPVGLDRHRGHPSQDQPQRVLQSAGH